MSRTIRKPYLTQEGVAFMVSVDFLGRQCIVTREALRTLSQLKSIDDGEADMLALFHAYEAKITGVARRLVAARVPGEPLVMRPNTFGAPHTE